MLLLFLPAFLAYPRPAGEEGNEEDKPEGTDDGEEEEEENKDELEDKELSARDHIAGVSLDRAGRSPEHGQYVYVCYVCVSG